MRPPASGAPSDTKMLPSDDLRARPIPAIDPSLYSSDYRRTPFDFDDPRSREPLVDIAGFGLAGESYYARDDGWNEPYRRALKSDRRILCREGVARALAAVDRSLAPYGVELFVLDVHRDVGVQSALWDHFMDHARTLMPDAGEEELVSFTRTFVSDPRQFDPEDWRTWPVHSTGGAVDLTLRRRGSGEWLFMGTVFDDASPVSATDHFETLARANPSALAASGEAALRNRRLLYHAMRAEGFTNYAYEWWHYDLGTQLWAKLRSHEEGRAVAAVYGHATDAG